jgi:hypothetical protein
MRNLPPRAEDLAKEDPPFVVVDEVVGQWTALAGAAAWNWKAYWPASFCPAVRHLVPAPVPAQRLHGGLGIVADDLMAGLYAALVLRAMGWFNLCEYGAIEKLRGRPEISRVVPRPRSPAASFRFMARTLSATTGRA